MRLKNHASRSNLPEQERELTADEVKSVKGGSKVEIGALKAGASEVLMETVTKKDPRKP